MVFFVVLFTSFWIWEIFKVSILLGLLVIITSFTLFKNLERKNINKLLIILLLLLTFLQFKSTNITSLTKLDDSEITIQQRRLNEYPPIHISLYGKTLWIPVAHWFEEKNITIASFRLFKNFSEVVDPSLYFFANHPRERVGFREFEKLHFIFLPFFLLGLFSLLPKVSKKLFIISLIIPITLLTIIGSLNPLGPFALFPFIISITGYGVNLIRRRL